MQALSLPPSTSTATIACEPAIAKINWTHEENRRKIEASTTELDMSNTQQLRDALQSALAELNSVLESCNGQRVHHDGDEFHERLEQIKKALSHPAPVVDERKAFEAELEKMPEWATEFEPHRAWVEKLLWDMWQARALLAAHPVSAPAVLFNGLTEAETNATASVMGLTSAPAAEQEEPMAVATVRTIQGVIVGYLEKRLPDGTKLYDHPQPAREQPSQDMIHWCAYVGGMVALWVKSDPDACGRLGDEAFGAAIAGIIARRLWAMPKPAREPMTEVVQRDAARWREVVKHVGADRQCGGYRFTLYTLLPVRGSNPMQSAVCQHFEKAIDAARGITASKEGGE
jgi:hypothetical protein